MKIILIPLLFAFLFVLGTAQAQLSTYDVSGFAGSLDLTETSLTMNYSGTCRVQMASTNTFTTNTGSFDSTISWRSPDTNIIGFSTLTGLSNTSCLSYGRTSLTDQGTDPTSTFYESSYFVSHSADSGFITTETRYVCDVPTDTITFEIGRGLDSRGDCQYRRRAATGLHQGTWVSALNTNYNRCGDLSSWIDIACNNGFASGGAVDVTIQYIYPFNSSSTGTVGYNFSTSVYTAGSAVTPTVTYDIVDAVGQTNTTIHTEAGPTAASHTFAAFSGVSSLTPERMHLFVVTYQVVDNGIAYTSTINPPIINLSIFTFTPDYVCGDFGACLNGTQSQVCVDSFGVAPDEIRTVSCFDVPAHSIDLGFEISSGGTSPPGIYTCQQDWGVLGCVDVLSNITSAFPVNWTISADADLFTGAFRQNYIRITGDTSTVGTKSLQMNYIPPKPSEPINNGTGGTVCGNKTSGDFPFVTTGLNQSAFVSINITFPSPFIQLRWDARKCSDQILQFDYTGDFLGINCGKRCYAANCTGEPAGRYRVGLFDADTLLEIKDVSNILLDNAWSTENIVDLSNEGLLVGHNYTIIITVNPEEQTGVFDPNAHCVYFDNFRITITDQALPECVTICDPSNPLNQLIAREDGNSCIFRTVINSPQCSPDLTTSEAFQNFEDVCVDTTLHFFNNDTGLWDRIEDSQLCESQAATIEEDLNITSPLEDTASYIEFFDFLFSPVFIYMIFALIISGILAAGIARITKNGDGVFQVFGVTMLIFVLLGSLPGIAVIPIWISIAIIAVISLLIAQRLRGFGFSGGGG